MSLHDAQELFWRAIRWPTGVEDFLAQADPQTRAQFERTFVSTEAFSAVERVNVYAEAYFWRQFDVLRDGFPALAFALGEVDFRNLITDYVLAHPSEDPALRHLGDRLPEFVRSHALGLAAPWLYELAQLEHWRYRLLDVRDGDPLTRADLARFSIDRWPGLRFSVGPAVQLLVGHYDVHAAWLASREPGREPEPPAGGPDAEYYHLVWRKGFAVVHRRLEVSEGRALQTLFDGGSFHEISAHAELDEYGIANPAQVVGWLQTWLDAGLLDGVGD